MLVKRKRKEKECWLIPRKFLKTEERRAKLFLFSVQSKRKYKVWLQGEWHLKVSFKDSFLLFFDYVELCVFVCGYVHVRQVLAKARHIGPLLSSLWTGAIDGCELPHLGTRNQTWVLSERSVSPFHQWTISLAWQRFLGCIYMHRFSGRNYCFQKSWKIFLENIMSYIFLLFFIICYIYN